MYLLVLSLTLPLGLAGRGVETAEAASSGDWNYEKIGSDIKITGYTGTETDVRIPETIMDSDGINYQVAQIGKCAFKDCSSLVSISVPKSVYWIEDNAFEGCSSLTGVEIPEDTKLNDIGKYAFSGCSKLESIILPSGVTRIKGHVFEDCSGLKQVTIPKEVTAIEDGAFSNCSSLTEIELPEKLSQTGGCVFSGCSSLESVTIPSGMKEISLGTFENCSSLTSVSIPSGVTKLGDCAFIGCSSLSDISLPDAMTEMGLNVFCGCSSLTQVTLPDGITEIPFGTFRNCVKLADIQFSDELTSIGNFVFDGCTSLTQIDIPEGVTSLGTNVFYHCTGLNSIKLPSTLESIGKKAFVGTSLESLKIPENVSSIGEGLFNGLDDYEDDSYTKIKRIVVDEQNTTYDSRDNCNAIIETATDTLLYGSNSTNIIPEGIKVIGKYSFSGCKDLESIEIPSTVNDVEGHIFAKCSNLSKITVSPDNRTYDSRGDCNGIIETSSNILVSGCKATVIPAEVSEIQISAFSGCDGLLAIELPSAMREIKDMTFLGCTGLTSVRIPSGVTSIGISAFSRCKNLRSVYIPASVEKFGEFANESSNVFAGCSELVIYTVEGAKAVEFAKQYDIPYSFEKMPGEEDTPETPAPPETTRSPQTTATPVPPETTQPPQATVAPISPETTQSPQTTAKTQKKQLGKPVIKNLKNKSGKKVTVTLTGKISGAAGYQVAYGTKSSLKGQKKKTFKGTDTVISGLKKKKTYYVRVRAYAKIDGKTIYSTWSRTKSIKVKK